MTKYLYRSLFKTISFALLAASVAILSGCSGGSDSGSAGTGQPIYTAIFDAGSSGTRLSFYKVIPGNGGYPQITKLASKEYDDNGINDFLNRQGTITLVKKGKNILPGGQRPENCSGGNMETNGSGDSLEILIKDLGQNDVGPCVLEPLLLTLNSSLNENKLNKGIVKTELFATAGMRTEDTKNGGAWSTSQILNYYATMKTYVASIGFSTGEFKTINGNSEEGVWTWANLNDYYYNSFGGNTTVSQSAQMPVGNFEVGGSSMQIAFPTNNSPSDAENVYRVSINGRSFNVYSKTFLGLGGDDARKYVKAINYANNDGAKDCYATTANASNTKEDSGIQLYPSNQVIGISSFGYPFNSNLGNFTTPWLTVPNVPSPPLIGSLQLSGTPAFNLTNCTNNYATILDQVTSLERNKYGTFSDGNLASLTSFAAKLRTSNAPFVGVDNFFYTADDLNYKPSTGFDPSIFLNKLTTYCSTRVANDKYAQNVCPNGVFMYTYLFGSAGLFTGSSATFAGVLNPKDSNDETVLTWTRGYLLIKYAN